MDSLALNKEIKSKYQGLEFEEEGHKYKYNGYNLTPVSNVVEGFVEEFDTETIAANYAQKHNLKVEHVKEGWRLNNKIACDFGTSVHNFAEEYAYRRFFSDYDDYSTAYMPSNSHELGVVNYWNSLNNRYIPVSLELQMFSEKHLFAGTCDVLLFDTMTGGYVLLDYKTNKDIYKNFRGKLMLPPFEYLLDMPYNHYQIQLSLYQLLLEEKGYRVTDRIILWLKGDEGYEEFHTNDFTEILKQTMT